jgi:hypothetical protein
MNIEVNGHCPMGCGWTLRLSGAGDVWCESPGCPRPAAVGEILMDRETEHLVQFEAGTFTVLHPLRERLDNELLDCGLHAEIAALPGPPVAPGMYRAMSELDGKRFWEPVGVSS